MAGVLALLKHKATDWKDIKKVIGKSGEFLKSLKNFDVEKASEATLKKVRDKYIKDPVFNPQKLMAKSSAAANLCQWCIATVKYQGVWKKVEPKKKKLAEVTA